jgi:hypothetical protein
MAALSNESAAPAGDARAGTDELLAILRTAIDNALDQLRSTPPDELLETRYVGRKRIPSTVQGLLFHAAEHAQRHTGQIIATSKIVHGAASVANAAAVREACVRAAMDAYEDAGIRGLCEAGRWEAAVAAMRDVQS